MAREEVAKWEWMELFASQHGPSDPSTRLVLFALSLRMNATGEKCFPSQDTIASYTALSVRSVREHLKKAETEGWVKRYEKRRKGQAYFVHEYVATVPLGLRELRKLKPWENDPTWQRPAESAASPEPEKHDETDRHPANGAQHPATDARRAANPARHPANGASTGGNLRHDTRQNLPPIFSEMFSEMSSLNISKMFPEDSASASGRTTHGGNSTSNNSNPEPPAAAQRKAHDSKEQQLDKAAKLLKDDPTYPTGTLRKMFKLISDNDVLRLKSEARIAFHEQAAPQ